MHEQTVKVISHNSSTSIMTFMDRWIQTRVVQLLPSWCSTRLLTMMTLPISVLIVVLCGKARETVEWLWGINILIAMQYVTDTLDGAVGRARNEGYVRWGYYMDHLLDYVFLCSLVFGYSLLVPEKASWFVGIAAVFAGFMVNTFLLVAASDEFKIAFYGIGPTECRMMFIAVNTIVATRGTSCIGSGLHWVAAISSILLVLFVFNCQRRLARIDISAKNSSDHG